MLPSFGHAGHTQRESPPDPSAASIAAIIAAVAFVHVLTRPFDRVGKVLRGEGGSTGDDGGLAPLAEATVKSWRDAEARVDRGLGQLGALDDAA